MGMAQDWIDDYDLQIEQKLAPYAPGGPLWAAGYDSAIETGHRFDLGNLVGWSAKRVIINDYMPPGQLYATAHEIIISRDGWDALIRQIKLQQECKAAVQRIINDKMGDVLAWLREAGHDI